MPNEFIAARARKRAVALYTALKGLLEDTQHDSHLCGDPRCPVLRAQRLVAELEWAPPYKGKGDAT